MSRWVQRLIAAPSPLKPSIIARPASAFVPSKCSALQSLQCAGMQKYFCRSAFLAFIGRTGEELHASGSLYGLFSQLEAGRLKAQKIVEDRGS